MGINIDENKLVTFDEQREQFVNTSMASNPTSVRVNELLVYGIFKRLYARNNSGTPDSDGNPLIYAIKAKKGYFISLKECCLFMPNFYGITQRILERKKYNVVIPMPSSSVVTACVARRIHRLCQANNAAIYYDVFSKKTYGEVYEELRAVTVDHKEKQIIISLRRQIEKFLKSDSNRFFAMKDIDPSARRFIRPLKLNQDPVMLKKMLSGKSIVLVDDLLASGATLKSAEELLAWCDVKSVEAICLLSKK